MYASAHVLTYVCIYCIMMCVYAVPVTLSNIHIDTDSVMPLTDCMFNNVLQGAEFCAVPLNSNEGLDDYEVAWLEYGKWMLVQGFEYFESVVLGQLSNNMLFYKCARLCNPMGMRDYAFSAQTVKDAMAVEQLLVFAPLLKAISVDGLVDELPAYMEAVADIDATVSCRSIDKIMPFWASRQKEMPTWCALVRVVTTVTPSSAAAERVFSIMNSQFGDNQASALDDYVGTSVKLCFNKRQA